MEARPDGWYFDVMPASRPRADLINEEFFKEQTRPDSLVREAIQNSLDQRLPTETKVTVKIWISGDRHAIPPERAQHYLHGLVDHVEAVPEMTSPTPNTPMPFLRIEDYGTTGLIGDPTEVDGTGTENHFRWFWRNEGRTGKASGKRGSRGVGKWVFPGSSGLRAFFGFSVTANPGEVRLMGKAVLKVHQLGGATYDWYGFFCSPRDGDNLQLPVTDPGIVDRFRRDFDVQRTAPGLSIVVPYPDASIDAPQLLQVVVENYFYPILKDELLVEMRDVDNRIRIDKNTIGEYVPDGLRAMVDMAKWSVLVNDEDRQKVEVMRPVWEDQKFPVQEVRSRLASDGVVAIRVFLPVEKKGGPRVRTYFDVFLATSAGSQEPDECYIRQGITIAGQKGLRHRGIRGLVVVDDAPLAELLRDAEGPAHRNWVKSDPRVDRRYRDGPGVVAFVANSLRSIGDCIGEKPQGRETNLLARIFSIPSGGSRRRTENPPGPNPPPPPPPPSKPRRFDVTRVEHGFSISLEPGRAAPQRGRLEVAYNIRRGNPFGRYAPDDFALGTPPVHMVVRSGRVWDVADNRLSFEALGTDFRLEIVGFDENRDLRTRVTEAQE